MSTPKKKTNVVIEDKTLKILNDRINGQSEILRKLLDRVSCLEQAKASNPKPNQEQGKRLRDLTYGTYFEFINRDGDTSEDGERYLKVECDGEEESELIEDKFDGDTKALAVNSSGVLTAFSTGALVREISYFKKKCSICGLGPFQCKCSTYGGEEEIA